MTRLWDNFTSHPKIIALSSDSVRWTWVRVLEYASKYRTEWLLNPFEIRGWSRSKEVEYLTPPHGFEFGLLELVDGRLRIHDFHDYQAKDATAAERQRRHRAKIARDGHPVTDRDAERDVSPRDSRAGVPVQSINSLSSRAMERMRAGAREAENEEEEREESDKELQTLALRAGWGAAKRTAAEADADRALAWLRTAFSRRDIGHPGAWAWACFGESGAWPVAEAPVFDPLSACRRWLASHGVDRATDTANTVRDELARIVRRCGADPESPEFAGPLAEMALGWFDAVLAERGIIRVEKPAENTRGEDAC